MADEKGADYLPGPQAVDRSRRTQSSGKVLLRSVSVLVVLTVCWTLSSVRGLILRSDHLSLSDSYDLDNALCPQIDPLVPKHTSDELQELESFLESSSFRNSTIQRLSDLVQIPSISYDDMGPADEDERFDIFYKIEEFLEKTYPLVHKHLKKEVVNVHGLLYTWEGLDSSLKPTLLMAHQDVVPVEKSTIDAWEYPPFSGHYDGKYIWGRGASDCKNQLTAVLETVELLLNADFSPKRTVLLSFGFDEEVSGGRGAGHLGPFIEKRYGKHGIAALVDEGAGMLEAWGAVYASPGVAEKGYTDVDVTVRMPGGHSSVPSDHTSIGVLSEFITIVESTKYAPFLDESNPYLGALQCGAKYSPEFPSDLKRLLRHRSSHGQCKAKKDHLAEEAAKQGPFQRYLVQTSQAVDLIAGGAKVNALPEKVTATINHRINIGSHPEAVYKKLTHIAHEIAKKYKLEVHAFDGINVANSIGLYASNSTLEPAPVTPIDLEIDGKLSPYGVISGSTRAVYGTDINIAPALMTGNTDTRYYWGVTKHIFRYGPGYEPGEPPLGNIHTINERQSVAAHINTVKWFVTFVRNMDETDVA